MVVVEPILIEDLANIPTNSPVTVQNSSTAISNKAIVEEIIIVLIEPTNTTQQISVLATDIQKASSTISTAKNDQFTYKPSETIVESIFLPTISDINAIDNDSSTLMKSVDTLDMSTVLIPVESSAIVSTLTDIPDIVSVAIDDVETTTHAKEASTSMTTTTETSSKSLIVATSTQVSMISSQSMSDTDKPSLTNAISSVDPVFSTNPDTSMSFYSPTETTSTTTVLSIESFLSTNAVSTITVGTTLEIDLNSLTSSIVETTNEKTRMIEITSVIDTTSVPQTQRITEIIDTTFSSGDSRTDSTNYDTNQFESTTIVKSTMLEIATSSSTMDSHRDVSTVPNELSTTSTDVYTTTITNSDHKTMDPSRKFTMTATNTDISLNSQLSSTENMITQTESTKIIQTTLAQDTLISTPESDTLQVSTTNVHLFTSQFLTTNSPDTSPSFSNEQESVTATDSNFSATKVAETSTDRFSSTFSSLEILTGGYSSGKSEIISSIKSTDASIETSLSTFFF